MGDQMGQNVAFATFTKYLLKNSATSSVWKPSSVDFIVIMKRWVGKPIETDPIKSQISSKTSRWKRLLCAQESIVGRPISLTDQFQ